jgi:hypothetical protein
VNAEAFLRRLQGVVRRGDGWQARCAAHDDGRASLSVTAGGDGKIVIHCHAGCQPQSIVAALGLTLADLFPDNPERNGNGKRIVATYDYRDADGGLRFQVCRMEPKDFRQRRPDGKGDWIWDMTGIQRVIYRLPEVRESVARGIPLIICEGEKDADALAESGFETTCNVGGAGKWRPEYSDELAGADVAIIADKDAAGRKHAQAVAESLLGKARIVRVLELPDVAGKPVKDAFDFFAAGGTAEQLRAIIEAAPEFVPVTEQASCCEGEPEPEPTPWPAPLEPAAFHGLAGEVVRVIDRNTEADPAAVLVMFLSAFGNLSGAGPHFLAEASPHCARFWPVLVGETGKGRKGSAWSSLTYILRRVDPEWSEHCVASGLSSEEGLIYAVRDPVVRQKTNKAGVVEDYVEDQGVSDKRLLTVEQEFSAVLKVAARDGNTVSDILRRAWEATAVLRTLTRQSPLRATGAHISVIGHITKPDLARLLSETDSLNGFGNRFAWAAVRRSKLLPEGGALHEENLNGLTLRLREARDFAGGVGLFKRSDDARAYWREIYPVLTADRAGVLGAITNRAEAQVMRVALIYALLDRSAVIEVTHLEAALAVWNYCDRSARFIFGDALGSKIADRIVAELRSAGARGLTRNGINEMFKGNVQSARIGEALALLERLNLATRSRMSHPNGGRPSDVWCIVSAAPVPRIAPVPFPPSDKHEESAPLVEVAVGHVEADLL